MVKLFDKDFQANSSSTEKGILETGIGYRNDNFRTSITYTMKEVLEFEALELDNTTMIESIMWNLFGKELDLYDADEDKILACVDKIVKELKLNLGGEPYGFWMTSIEGVKSNYAELDGSEITITAYEIPEDGLIIEDLGDDGCLIASLTPFCNLTKIEEV